MNRRALSLCAAASLAIIFVSPPSQAQMVLTAEQSQLISSLAAAAAITVDLNSATETLESSEILYCHSEQPGLMLLVDMRMRRGVVAEDLMPNGLRFVVVDPERRPDLVELYMDGQGYFGEAEVLAALGVTDASLANWQDQACLDPCVEHAHMAACAACTGAGLILRLRTATPVPVTPTPESSPMATPSPDPTLSWTSSPVAEPTAESSSAPTSAPSEASQSSPTPQDTPDE